MSINSAMHAGLSGILANATALATISDGISNVGTIGYKRGEISFESVVAAVAASNRQVGGVAAQIRQAVSEQGKLQATGSATDLGISGEGFFIVTTTPENVAAADSRAFTRAGSFTPDTLGYLRNSSGFYLQGWPVGADGEVSADPSDLTRLQSINVNSMSGTAAQTALVSISANLQASQAVSPFAGAWLEKPNVPDSVGASHDFKVSYSATAGANQWTVTVSDSAGFSATGDVTFDPVTHAISSSTLPGSAADLALGPSASVPLSALGLATDSDAATQYNPQTNSMADFAVSNGSAGVKPDYSIQMPITDSKGARRVLELDFLKSAVPNQWYAELRATSPDDVVTGAGLGHGQLARGVIAFTPDGKLDTAASTLFPNPENPVITFGPSGGGAPAPGGAAWAASLGLAGQAVKFELGKTPGGLTQLDGPSVVQDIASDGVSFGNLVDVEVDSAGVVTSNFDNGVSRKIAQVALATFPNPDGLQAISGDAYHVAATSGGYSIKQPGTGGSGVLRSSTLEASNVDLAAEFTGLISTQRAYSACSKIISAADQMTQEVLDMKR